MKKLFLLFVVGVMALSSCKQEPSLTLSARNANAAAAGEVLTVDVTSNCEWKATCADQSIAISPAEGLQGTSTVSVTVPENPTSTPKEYKLNFVATNETGMISVDFIITQQGADANITVAAPADLTLNGYESSFKVNLTASNDWSVTTEGEGITVEPASGTYGEYELTVTISENTTNDKISYKINYALSDNSASGTLSLEQPVISTVALGGVDYKVKWLPDGRLWMVENLRFIPEGKTPSTDLTAIENGVWFPVDSVNKVLSDNEELIQKQGYLYNMEAAFGLAPGTITAETYATYEGTQGICPEGWHIPTAKEYVDLFGKSVHKDYKNDAAPFYDTETQYGSIAKANEAGWNVNWFGYVNVTNFTATKGSVVNTIGYLMGSTAYTTEMGAKNKNDDGTLKNAQYFSAMASTNKAAGPNLSAAYSASRSGMAVRCIRNK
jgi:uncharacterized protein (TIGR02145 family)